MANVSPFIRTPETPHAEVRLHRRIELASRALAGLFTVLAAADALMVAILLAGVLIYHGPGLRIGPTNVWIVTPAQRPPAGSVAIGSLPLAHRIIYFFVGAVRAAPSLAILLGLRRLFGLYARGEVFEPENARQIKLIGLWLAADAVIPFAEHLLQRGLGVEIDHSWLHMVSLQELVLGALVFVIAEVMGVGHEIERERREFI